MADGGQRQAMSERLTPIPAEQQAAFKAEVPTLRKTLQTPEQVDRVFSTMTSEQRH
jgi:hypothetical protein